MSVLGTAYGPDKAFTTRPAPVLSTGAAGSIADLSAVLSGAVNPGGDYLSIQMEYGTSTDYGSIKSVDSNPGSATTLVAVTATVTTLLPNTTYHYRLRASDGLGGNHVGADQTFTTTAPATAPQVTGFMSLQSVMPSQATVCLTRCWSGSSPAALTFEFGNSPAYGSEVNWGTIPANAEGYYPTVTLPGLTPLTTYHVRCKLVNGEGVDWSPDMEFTTTGIPVITTDSTREVTSHSAVVDGTVAPMGNAFTAVLEYGTTTDYGSMRYATVYYTFPEEGPRALTAVLDNLEPGTTYHCRFREGMLGEAFWHGNDLTFTTLSPAESWRWEHFGTVANAGDAADTASPAGDGMPNLLKYALGLDPMVGAVAAPQVVLKDYGDMTCLSMIFSRDPAKTDIIYEVQGASDIAGPWTTLASSHWGNAVCGAGLVSEGAGAGGSVQVEVRDCVGGAGGMAPRFMRLQVTR